MNYKRLRVAILVLVLVVAQLPWSHPARAATYTVNTTNDNDDGSCDSFHCSLREAINAANANSSPDTIEFDIDATTDPGCDTVTRVCTIRPTGALPALTDDGTTIDGYTQSGAAPATSTTPAELKIELDGTNAGAATDGLTIDSADNTIRGLAVNRFDYFGVVIFDDGNTVSGNHIGTDASGTTALGNGESGAYIASFAKNNIIGGDTPDERNVISGNDENGVRIVASGTMSNTVSGNYIGLAADGTSDLGNGITGINIASYAHNNTIGGNTAGERNIISCNHYGITIHDSGTMSNTVSGNYIGTDASGTLARGNAQRGIYIGNGAQGNIIGPGNVIAHNGSDGVEVNGSSTSGNTITRNSIFSNTMGIDLVSQANGGIDAPDIVTTTVGSINILGTACAGCTVEVFENSDTDGEGETYVGDTTANASGVFTVSVSSLSNPYLTATAMDAISGTSEFSEVFTATMGSSVYLPIVLKNH